MLRSHPLGTEGWVVWVVQCESSWWEDFKYCSFNWGYDIVTLLHKNHYPAMKLLVPPPNEQFVINAKKWNWQRQKSTLTCWWLALWAPFSRNCILNHKHQVLDVACVKFMITMQNNVKQSGMLWRSVFWMGYGRRLTQNSANRTQQNLLIHIAHSLKLQEIQVLCQIKH